MVGIKMDLQKQVRFLREAILPFQSEYIGSKLYLEGIAGKFGPGYGFIEAQAYHGLLRWLKPERVIEIGSGISTYCATQAARLNAADTGHSTEIICIEPYPTSFLQASKDIRLIRSRVEEVSPEFFECLREGDLL